MSPLFQKKLVRNMSQILQYSYLGSGSVYILGSLKFFVCSFVLEHLELFGIFGFTLLKTEKQAGESVSGDG
jgi:hypothetical protein